MASDVSNNYRNRCTGHDNGEPNYIEEMKCDHCGKWVEEAEEDGDKFICKDCLPEFVRCSRCGEYELKTDIENGLCYECDKDDRLNEAIKYFKGIQEENIRTNWSINDPIHKHAGIVYLVLKGELYDRELMKKMEDVKEKKRK